ncbi:MAG: SDR family oxidoreductase [Clostridiaceae bacterium]|nr:SDR family oxidoreductase [Clostridiaceae bacterium]
MFDISGRVAFVTGASKGLGKVFALALGRAGAKLCILSRTEDDLRQTEQELKSEGCDCISYFVDIRNEQEVEKAVEGCVEKYGRIDILVNNAATARINKPPEETSLNEWEYVIDTNINGSFICAKAVGKVMLKQKSGKIINMSSMSGKIINKGIHGGSYDVSKQGIDGMTRALSSEWAQYGINVNAIAPGYFMTDPNIMFFEKDPDFYKTALESIPAGRIGRPEELVGTLLYLASDASDYVHGAIISVDGGYTIW